MEYVQMELQMTAEEYVKQKEAIKSDLGAIVKSFVTVGWRLSRIDKSQAYKNDGYKTISEFAKAEYDMNPAGVSRFISVYEEYSIPGDTPELKEQYREFKFAKLVEMLQLPEEDRQMFQPEAKREDIRELRRFNQENDSNPDNLLNWQQEEKNPIRETVIEFFRINRDLLNEIYKEHIETIEDYVDRVNPSGNRSFRHGTDFVMMYSTEKGIMLKHFGAGTENIKWQRFMDTMREIFPDNGSRTWETYFGDPVTKKEEPKEEQKKEEKKPEKKPEIPYQQNQKKAVNSIQEDASEQKEKPEVAPAQKEPEYDQERDTENTDRTEIEHATEPHHQETAAASEEPQEEPTGVETVNQKQEPDQTQDPDEEQDHTRQQESDATIDMTTRKDYIDTLTAKTAADYIWRHLNADTLNIRDNLEKWLKEKVDLQGHPLEHPVSEELKGQMSITDLTQ